MTDGDPAASPALSPEEIWRRHSDAWSNPDAEVRAVELAVCLVDDVTYCDPNGLI